MSIPRSELTDFTGLKAQTFKEQMIRYCGLTYDVLFIINRNYKTSLDNATKLIKI